MLICHYVNISAVGTDELLSKTQLQIATIKRVIVPLFFICRGSHDLIFSQLQAIETCVAAAGFSVGEFAALVFAGSMNFAEGKHKVTRFAASKQ